MINKPDLEKVAFTFNQEGNTLGTTEEYEQLTIEIETQTGDILKIEENGELSGFFVFRTKGWSMDNVNEFEEIIRTCNSALSAMRDALEGKSE